MSPAYATEYNPTMSGAAFTAFLGARDFLLAHRTDYETACRDFRWPTLTHFNWALHVRGAFDAFERRGYLAARPRRASRRFDSADDRQRTGAPGGYAGGVQAGGGGDSSNNPA
jgi:hypothetical protein